MMRDLHEQAETIEKYVLNYSDGVECWYPGYDAEATAHYIEFTDKYGLIMTGGSDCYQSPLLLGTVDIAGWVAAQLWGKRVNLLKNRLWTERTNKGVTNDLR